MSGQGVSAAAIGDRRIADNALIHDRLAARYDKRHSEIFNDREQTRLAASLARAVAAAERPAPLRALDMGCGTGNLTRHLLALGCHVTAADVSTGFLTLVAGRFAGRPLETSQLNGIDLGQFPDRAFDLIATYSVLHHIPDYLAAVVEMGRVCAVGGIVYIDHELAEHFWQPDPLYAEFKARVAPRDWRKFFKPHNYYGKLRRLFEPRFANEGDIHVWPDDHIEWRRIAAVLGDEFEVVTDQTYLLFDGRYRPAVYDVYRDRLSDMRTMAFRRTR